MLKKKSTAVFFSQDQGKFIAHYKMRFSVVDIFAGALIDAEYSISPASKYAYLNFVEVINSSQFVGLKSYYFSQFFLDTVYLLFPQGQQNSELFQYMYAFIDEGMIALVEQSFLWTLFFTVRLLHLLGFFLPESLYTSSEMLGSDLKKMMNCDEAVALVLRRELALRYAAFGKQITTWVFGVFEESLQVKKIEKLLIIMRKEKIWG